MAILLLIIVALYLLCLAHDFFLVSRRITKSFENLERVEGGFITSFGRALEAKLQALEYRINALNWEAERSTHELNLPASVDSFEFGELQESPEVKFYRSIIEAVSRSFRASVSAIMVFDANAITNNFISASKQAGLQEALYYFLTPFLTASSSECFGRVDLEEQKLFGAGLQRYGLRYCVTVPFKTGVSGDAPSHGVLWLGYSAESPPTDLELGWALDLSQKIEQELKGSKKLFELSGRVLEAQTAMQQKTDFMLHLSHDIRSPLNNIKAILSLFQVESLQSENYDLVEAALRNCDSVADMVSDILDFARHQAGKLMARTEVLNLRETVRAAVNEFSISARVNGLDLTLEEDPNPVFVNVDRRQIKRVISNLISNAIKYTERGSVRVSLDSDGAGRCQVSVSDSGQGMSADEVARLFTPFTRFRADSSDGFGLGLALSRILVELNSGKISVKSTPGQGTCFSVEFPEAQKLSEVVGG